MRFFNTTGPVVAGDHYLIPPLDRVDLAELRRLIAQKRYFVLRAPRQTGKTSALLALQELLNADGDYRCVYANVEGAQPAREDVGRAIRAVLSELASRADDCLGDDSLEEIWPEVLAKHGPDAGFRVALTRWARAVPKPLVLLIDEIDALAGDSLLSVLRQLRAGYDMRPDGFPQSVNSGGRIEREYGLGRGRTDLLVLWPEGGGRVGGDGSGAGSGGAMRMCKYVVECKVLRKGLERTVAEGVEQTAYMDGCGAEAGHLVVFDRREGRSWDEKVFRLDRTAENGTEITVWGM